MGLGFAFYVYCFYMLQVPYACYDKDIANCAWYFDQDLLILVLERVAVFGLPTLIGIFIARKSNGFLLLWIVLFSGWSLLISKHTPYGVDGKLGCDTCDFTMIIMNVASVASIIVSIIVAVFKWALMTEAKRLQQDTTET